MFRFTFLGLLALYGFVVWIIGMRSERRQVLTGPDAPKPERRTTRDRRVTA